MVKNMKVDIKRFKWNKDQHLLTLFKNLTNREMWLNFSVVAYVPKSKLQNLNRKIENTNPAVFQHSK